MKDYLIFRLYGPMASWGLPAVGGDRPSGLSPGRAALVGMLAAALGIRREQQAELDELQDSITLAVKQVVPSSVLRDYHTSQVPSQKKGVVHRSRKSELSVSKLNTVLSSRDYRCDGLWIVAVSLTSSATVSLERLRDALNKPVFTLFLGRKSCPLAVPVAARLVKVASVKEALDTEFPSLTHSLSEDALWLNKQSWVTYYWEGDKHAIQSAETLVTHPWDVPLHRKRWQFGQRALYQLTMMESTDVSVENNA